MMDSKPSYHPMQRRTPFFVEWHFATHVLHMPYKRYLKQCDELERKINYWGEVMANAYESYWNTLEKDRRWWPYPAPKQVTHSDTAYQAPRSTIYDAYGNLANS